MKPWANDGEWFRRYARTTAHLKGLGAKPATIRLVRQAIVEAFQNVYRMVAFDVDGTLTRPGRPVLDVGMVELVAGLLRRAVPVVLITGRGRTSAKSAVDEIRVRSDLSPWYLRRLQCVTHNGVFLLSTPIDNVTALLSEQHALGRGLDSAALRQLSGLVSAVLKDGGAAERVTISHEPRSLRLTFERPSDRSRAESLLRPALRKRAFQPFGKLFLTQGTYANTPCLDIASTNKGQALDVLAERMGLRRNKILRIGDQGQRGGNDFDLLDSQWGFSVANLSDVPGRCLPVLDDALKTQLLGAAATRQLLRNVLLFAPLSIDASPFEARRRALRSFEALALRRARQEAQTLTGRVKMRVRYLLPDSPHGASGDAVMDLSDLYDPLSGGVRLRDWELPLAIADDASAQLFNLKCLDAHKAGPPNAVWAMYTDSGILLRGPAYYFGLSRPTRQRTLRAYVALAKQFIDGARGALSSLVKGSADLIKFKLCLGIADNVRNILLQFVAAGFMSEARQKAQDYALTKAMYRRGLLPHTEAHVDLLMNPDASWARWLTSYRTLLGQIARLLKDVGRKLQPRSIDASRLFKWRECDNFLQNLTAIQLGLYEHGQRWPAEEPGDLVTVGLAYGALELPAIAAVVARARGINVAAAYAHVSLYNDKRTGKLVRGGSYDYVSKVLLRGRSLCMLDGGSIADRRCVVLDDNCTTAVTLQLARDSLVMLGSDVAGAILVRFPSANRIRQMAMPGHGCPDPEVLFGLIRGLVAPSPYTRLLQAAKRGNKYLDVCGSFDKARDRITRYVQKNER